MKDPTLDLQKLLFTTLSHDLAWDVYDRVPDDAVMPYITLDGITGSENGTKDCFEVELIATLSVHDGFTGDAGGKSNVLDIGEQIIGVLRGRPPIFQFVSDFKIVWIVLDFAETVEQELNTIYLYQRVLRFRCLVEELPTSP